MGLLLPVEGSARMLDLLMGSEDMLLRLYINDKAPAPGDSAGDYLEMSSHGYTGAKTLAAGGWVIVPGQPSMASHAQQEWAFHEDGPSRQVYGYYVTGASSGLLLWAERFSGLGFKIQDDGDRIVMTPRFTQGPAA